MSSKRYKFLSKLKTEAIQSNKEYSEQVTRGKTSRAESPVRYSENFTLDHLQLLGNIADSDDDISSICFETSVNCLTAFSMLSPAHAENKINASNLSPSQARDENTDPQKGDGAFKINSCSSYQTLTNVSPNEVIADSYEDNSNIHFESCSDIQNEATAADGHCVTVSSLLPPVHTEKAFTALNAFPQLRGNNTGPEEGEGAFKTTSCPSANANAHISLDYNETECINLESNAESFSLNNSAKPLTQSFDPNLATTVDSHSPLMTPSQITNGISAIESPNISPLIAHQINQLRSADFRPVTPGSSVSCFASSPLLTPQTSELTINVDSESTTAELLPGSRKRKSRAKANRADIGKLRKVHKDLWIDTIRKKNKNSGKEYKSRNGKVREQKNMGETCKNTCKLKCFEKICVSDRKKLFEAFWSMGDLIRYWDFIAKNCEKIPKRRITTETDSRRQYTIRYSLPINKEIDSQPLSSFNEASISKVRVCKVMFLNTFGIKQGFVYSALSKLSPENMISQDLRGRHLNHKKVVTPAMIVSVCDHVKCFAPVESHYVRSRSTRLYLDESLSIARMFLLYQEWEDPEAREKVNTCRQYRDIANSNFNLGFYIPKKDMCDVCHVYKNLNKPVTEEESIIYNTHIRNKTIARELKNKDKEHSLQDKTVLTAVYDFQKVHGMPCGETSILYYKRKLSVFNFTVFDMGMKLAKCYVWDESIAKRGANEVGSCLYDYIEEHAQKGVKKFNFWSDNCGGQNRNRIVFAAYLRAANDFNVTISHKYLEKGHTQNEGDSVHALIERTSKHKMVYTPEQWYALIRWAKQDGNPYLVKEMTTADFIDFKMLLPGCNWTLDTDSKKMFWSHIKQLQVTPNSTQGIQFKTDFCDHEYKCIQVCKTQETPKTRNRQRNKVTVDNTQLPFHSRRLQQAYDGKLSLPKAKIQDLKYLCQHNIIPSIYHSFYNNLREGDESNTNDEEADDDL